MAPLAVDPKALYAAGSAAGGIGDGLAANLTILTTGYGANTGADLAGLAFGRGYRSAAKSLLSAAAGAVNACRQIGALIQQGASNYSHVDAASTLGGGGEPLPAPAPPTTLDAPGPPKTSGPGQPPPMLWRIVQAFVHDVWPNGDVAGLHADADRWKAFAVCLGGVQRTVGAAKTLLDTQHIPEGDHIDQALDVIGASTELLGNKCDQLAKRLDSFAGDVDRSQRAIRDLLDELSSLGDLGHDVMLIIEGDALDEIERIGRDIDGVLSQLGREARALENGFKELVEAADCELAKFEKYTRKGLVKIFGEEVGNPLATALNAITDIQEVPLRSAISMGLDLVDLSPHWLLVDRDGLANTYEQLGKNLWKGSLFNAAINPREAGQAMLQELKGLVHAEDWGGDRPALGPAETAFDIGTLAAPVIGELRGAGAVGRAAGSEGEAAGVAGRAGEEAGGFGGNPQALSGITKTGEDLTKNLQDATKDLPKIEPPPSGQPVSPPATKPLDPPPVESVPKPPEPGTPQASGPPKSPPAAPPVAEAPVTRPAGGPHAPDPAAVPPAAPGGPRGVGEPAPTPGLPGGAHQPVPAEPHAAAGPEPAPPPGGRGLGPSGSAPGGHRVPGTGDEGPHGGNPKGTPLHNGDAKGSGDAENPRDPGEPDSSHEHPREGEAGTYPLPAPALLAPPADGAYFWSGRTSEGVGIGPISADGNGAADIWANSHGGTTLEGLLERNGIKGPLWSFEDKASQEWWSQVSRIYAENARGEVHAVIGSNLRPGNVWQTVELPRLMDNPNVTKIIMIDPETGKETTIFER